MRKNKKHLGDPGAAITVKAARPGKHKRAPDFVVLKDDKGKKIGGETKPGACKETGCYGKFFVKDGLPHMSVCSGGKVSGQFKVESVADAKKQLSAACTRRESVARAGRLSVKAARSTSAKPLAGFGALRCLRPVDSGIEDSIPVDVSVETPAYLIGKPQMWGDRKASVTFDLSIWRKVPCAK